MRKYFNTYFLVDSLIKPVRFSTSHKKNPSLITSLSQSLREFKKSLPNTMNKQIFHLIKYDLNGH